MHMKILIQAHIDSMREKRLYGERGSEIAWVASTYVLYDVSSQLISYQLIMCTHYRFEEVMGPVCMHPILSISSTIFFLYIVSSISCLTFNTVTHTMHNLFSLFLSYKQHITMFYVSIPWVLEAFTKFWQHFTVP